MRVTVKYFASLRERAGEAGSVIELEDHTSVGELWQSVMQRKRLALDNVMMVVNMQYVKPDHPLKSGDEVAFFPPVTGG